VFVNVTDPVGTGIVSSLAHPAGNITGFTNYEFSMGGKWLDILKEIAPSLTRVTVVFNADNPAHMGVLHSIEAAGPGLTIHVVATPTRNAAEFEQAIRTAASEESVGLLVLYDFLTLAHRELIIELANRYRLPAGYGVRAFASDDGLFSYGVDAIDPYRRAASYVDQILKGTRPADLPVQQPTKFELIINFKTAKSLDLTISPNLLAVADEVIE
jgi:putative ABC transport system substrate-binding protein